MSEDGGVERTEQAVTVANEMKQFAKRLVRDGGSNYEVDRRRGTPGSSA